MDKIDRAEKQIRKCIQKAVVALEPVVKMKLPVRGRSASGDFAGSMAESPNCWKGVRIIAVSVCALLKNAEKTL